MRPRARIEPLLGPFGLALLGAAALAVELRANAAELVSFTAQGGFLAGPDDDRTKRLALWACLWGAFVIVAGRQRRFLLRAVPEPRVVPGVATYRGEPRYQHVLSDDDDHTLRKRTRLAASALAASAACSALAEGTFAWLVWLSVIAFLGATTFVRHRHATAWVLGLPLVALGVLASTSVVGTSLSPLCAALGGAALLAWAHVGHARERFGGYGAGPDAADERASRERAKRRLGLACAVVALSTIGARSLARHPNDRVSHHASAGAPAAFRGDVPTLVDGGLLDARSAD